MKFFWAGLGAIFMATALINGLHMNLWATLGFTEGYLCLCASIDNMKQGK